VKVLTENRLRSDLPGTKYPPEYLVPPGTIITPAARSFLSDRGIRLSFGGTGEVQDPQDRVSENMAEEGSFFLIGPDLKVDRKPEHYTHLSGNKLVPKNHPRIELRGKLDSLQADIILAQVRIADLGREELVNDLQEILDLVKEILKGEVTGSEIIVETLMGFSKDQLREVSHHPEKYFDTGHFFPSREMGEVMALLNVVRTRIREAELVACNVFRNADSGMTREDILTLLNRLSSAIYIMMCKFKSNKY